MTPLTKTTPEQFRKLHRDLTEEALDLMARKNADYGADADAMANFRMSELLKIRPVLGAMLRMQDKMARLVSFIEKGHLAVVEESWHDCLIDLINYSVIVHGLLDEMTRERKP